MSKMNTPQGTAKAPLLNREAYSIQKNKDQISQNSILADFKICQLVVGSNNDFTLPQKNELTFFMLQ